MALDNIAPRDDNRTTVLMGTDVFTTLTTRKPVIIGADPATNRLLVSAVITSGGGGGTQYPELDITAPGTGTLVLGRYKSVTPTLTDGQMYGLQLDSSGNLKVTGSLSVGGTTDNSAYTAGSSTGTPAMGFYHSTIDAVTDGRTATIAITANRAEHVNLRNASGTELGTNANPVQIGDGAGSLTVDNSGTFAVQAAQSGTWNINNIVGTVSLPTGASTSALQTTGNSSLSSIDGKVPALGQALAAASIPVVLTAAQLSTLTPPTSVTVTQATGTNLHTVIDSGAVTATLAAETTKVIGTVNQGTSPWVSQVTSVTPGTGATNLGKAEDAAHVSGDVGVMSLGVRQDADTSPVSADGDYHAPIFNSIGRMKVSILPAQTAATTGTITTSSSAITADTSHASSVTVMVKGTYAGVNFGFFGSLDGGTTYVSLQSTRLDTNVVENTSGILTANTTRVWTVNVVGMTNFQILASAYTSGTANITIAIGAMPTEDTPAISGQTASGTTLVVNPVTTGGLAKTANPTAVGDGQTVNATFDKLGKQVTVGSIRDLKSNQVTTITSSTSETTIVSAVASTFLDMYGLIVTNTSATAVNVAIKDGTAGTTRLNIALPAGDTRGFMLPESGAVKQSAVNNNWTATCSASVASVIITALTVQNI